MRTPNVWKLLALVLLATSLNGCMLLGFDCKVDGSDAQKLAGGAPCYFFGGGLCCGDDDEDGFLDCGSLISAFVFPCAVLHDGCACGEPDGPFLRQSLLPPSFATYPQPSFSFSLGLGFTGMSTTHRLTFDVDPGHLQTFQGAVTYSSGFGFNGFTALGPVDTQIGTYGFDFDKNDTVDFAIALRAASAGTAYADVNGDGHQGVVDPTIQHVANVPGPGAHTFNLLLPAGGDAAPKIPRGSFAVRIHALLFAGILTNPASDGSYNVSGTFTSVDPDTGGASDGMNQMPLQVTVSPVAVGIAPSPLDVLDHFLCYKTKPSKGSICGPSASMNRGGVCLSDADCGNVAGACVKNKLPKGTQVGLADASTSFASRTVDVKKATRLCTPADKNAEGRHDVVTHLRGYQIKDAKGAPARVPQTSLAVLNQLGTIVVDATKPDTLYTPAAKSLGAPAAPLGANMVDRYQCYKAKLRAKRCAADPARTCKKPADCGIDGPCLGKFPKGLQVSVADQFTSPAKRFDVKKPTRLCLPALQNGSPITSPDGHLMCYQVKPAAGEPKHAKRVGTIHTTDDVARDRVDTNAEDELCVPSIVIPPA